MKLLGIFILYQENENDVRILQKEYNLANFGFFERRHLEPFLTFTARTTIERTERGIKQSIDLTERFNGVIHAYVRQDKIAAVVISDNEYPKRVAHSLLAKIMDEFSQMYPSNRWRDMTEGSGAMTSLSATLQKYQSPQDADPLMGLQKDLDETKGIMLKTLENVLKRGEDIDSLLAKSHDLSAESKMFLRTAKRNNRCCSWGS